MRTLITISIPADAGNAAVKDGALPKIMGEALERLKPEAAYFHDRCDGLRTALHGLRHEGSRPTCPSIAEPFFTGFNAAVTFSPVMTPTT